MSFIFFKKEGHSRPLFIYFVFSIQLIINKQMFNINFANDWSWTADLWYRKQPLYQLSHNHFPIVFYLVDGVGLDGENGDDFKMINKINLVIPLTIFYFILLGAKVLRLRQDEGENFICNQFGARSSQWIKISSFNSVKLGHFCILFFEKNDLSLLDSCQFSITINDKSMFICFSLIKS